MKMKCLAALTAFALFTGAGYAAERQDEAKKLKDRGTILPLEQVLRQARDDRPGRVVETELEKRHSGYVYEIKIVDEQGIVHEMKYDARSGERLKEKREK